MKQGERIIGVEGYYVLGSLELFFEAINGHIEEKEFKREYQIMSSSIRDYVCQLRGWKWRKKQTL